MRRIIMSLIAETKLYGTEVLLIHDQFNNQYLVYVNETLKAEFYSTELCEAFEFYMDMILLTAHKEYNESNAIVESIASGEDDDKGEVA